MRFLVDESLTPDLAIALRAGGFDAVSVGELGLRSNPDEMIFEEAQKRHSVVVSADLGFGRLAELADQKHEGIVIIRYSTAVTMSRIIEETVERLRQLDERDIKGGTVIIEPDRTRLRKDPS